MPVTIRDRRSDTNAQQAGALPGSIGVAGIVFLVIAAAAPLTAIGGGLPVMIAAGNGAGAPMAYIVAAVVLARLQCGVRGHEWPHGRHRRVLCLCAEGSR